MELFGIEEHRSCIILHDNVSSSFLASLPNNNINFIFQEEYFKLLKEKLDKVNSELAIKTQQNTKGELVSDY